MKHSLAVPALLLLMTLPGCASQGLPDVIFLARHGQTEWNRIGRWQGNPDLDQVGYINRVSLWHLLKDEPLRDIYTSSRQRTQRTAELLAQQHGLKVKVRPGLDEISSGIATGICWSQIAPHKALPRHKRCEMSARGSRPEVALAVIQKAYRDQENDPIKGRIPLGESLWDINLRSKPVVDELRRGLRERKILVVGHGVINRALLHQIMGWSLESLSHLRQENDQVYRIEGAHSGQSKLFLYTPGSGWKRCNNAPKPGDRHLDCSPPLPSPGAREPKPEPAPEPAPAPAPAPVSEPEAPPAEIK